MLKKKDIKNRILRYIGVIANQVPVEQVILFGSFASGTQGKYSDIDLAIFSPKFSNRTHLRDIKLLWSEAAKIDSCIEPLPFASAEAKNADPRSFLAEILKTGKVIYKS